MLFSPSMAWAAEAFGYTAPYRIARMSFPETGVITELPVREGARVKEGDILARLDYQVLQSELNMAEEQLRIRRLRFEKLEPLRAAGSVSLEEFERSKADLLIDEERAARIRAQIDNRTLTAPFDGIVSEIRKEMAESVSNAGVHVLTVVQLDTLQVEMHLRPADAARHREGGVVPLLLDDRETVQGRVEFISPVIDAASHTVRIRFTISNPTGTFRSGVRCSPADGNTMAATSSPSSGSDALPPRRMTRTTSETSERPAEDLDPVPPARNRRVLSGL